MHHPRNALPSHTNSPRAPLLHHSRTRPSSRPTKKQDCRPSPPSRVAGAANSTTHHTGTQHPHPVLPHPPLPGPATSPATPWAQARPLSSSEINDALTQTQSKSNPFVPQRGLMFPGPIAQMHPAGPLLQTYGTQGCPVDLAEEWSLEQLDMAVAYGAHPSARTPEAIAAIRQEALEKVDQGFVTLVPWAQLRRDIVAGTAPSVKISPIAAIPHKSRQFRLILDLSKKGQNRKGQLPTTAVNELTNQDAAPMDSMNNLGIVLPRVIHAMATQPTEQGPILMCKLDIKDGFWRMCVPAKDEHQFCYVLPSLGPTEETMLVVPSALQMGWTSSPPFFCAATETGRDVAEFLHQQPSLPPHPLEAHMVDAITPTLLDRFPFPTASPNMSTEMLLDYRKRIFFLFEDYVDDFVNLIQSTDPAVLRHASRALLHAIHQIFPPTIATGHAGEDPISYKKLVLEGEGVWDVRKEILGWIFDGAARTMELPEKKVAKIYDAITQALRHKHMEVKAFHSLLGKLGHAMEGTAGGKALMPPLWKALRAAETAHRLSVQIHRHSPQALALQDLRTLLRILGRRPTDCRQLAPGMPAYLGHSDSCKYGTGGTWIRGAASLWPLVWRLPWPEDIIALFDTGAITINDLEMAGHFIEFVLLDGLLNLKHKHTAIWCDNSSTVSWASKMSSSNSTIGQQLTRALALRYTTTQCSPLAPLPIAGEHNKMADLASRSFKHTGATGNYALDDHAFLTKFNSDFPLTQGRSWLLLRPSTKLSSLVFAVLRGKHVPAGPWTRLPKHVCDIGLIGKTSANTVEWTPSSPSLTTRLELTTSATTLLGLEKGMLDVDIKSALAPFRTRFAPSERPSSWLASTTPPTSPMPTKPTGIESSSS